MVRFGVRVSIFVGFVVFLTLVVYFGTRQPKPKPVQEIVTKARFQGNARKPIPGNIGKEKKEAAAQAEMGKDNGMAGLAAFFGNLKVETEKDVLAKTQKAAEVERVKNENFVVEAQAADEKEEEIASGSDKDGFKVSKKKKYVRFSFFCLFTFYFILIYRDLSHSWYITTQLTFSVSLLEQYRIFHIL